MNQTPLFIAVVDDEPAVCKALERLLRSAGMRVVTFTAGAAFLASLASGRRPDCVVLDLHMPETNGFEVQSRLAAEATKVPVVVITGHDSPAAQQRAMAGGASAYLKKPVDARPLFEAVRAAAVR